MKMDYFLGISEEGFHRVAYAEWGAQNNNEPPIICVHGLTRNCRDFDRLAAYLADKNRHLYCPDIVGRGDSDWLKNPLHYTYEQYIHDMNCLIAKTNAKQVDWIGTSMGGLIGMILASFENSPIRKLVLNDVGPQIPAKALARLSKYAGRDPEFKNIDDAVLYFKTIYADFGTLSENDWRALASNSVKEVAQGKFISKIDQRIKIAPAKSKLAWQAILHPQRALEGTLFDIDLWSIFRNVTCPILVIHGARSDILQPHIIQKMQAIHPAISVMEITDAGHAPALMQQSQHDMIYDWLNQA